MPWRTSRDQNLSLGISPFQKDVDKTWKHEVMFIQQGTLSSFIKNPGATKEIWFKVQIINQKTLRMTLMLGSAQKVRELGEDIQDMAGEFDSQ